jgi:hypothetical protein
VVDCIYLNFDHVTSIFSLPLDYQHSSSNHSIYNYISISLLCLSHQHPSIDDIAYHRRTAAFAATQTSSSARRYRSGTCGSSRHRNQPNVKWREYSTVTDGVYASQRRAFAAFALHGIDLARLIRTRRDVPFVTGQDRQPKSGPASFRHLGRLHRARLFLATLES